MNEFKCAQDIITLLVKRGWKEVRMPTDALHWHLTKKRFGVTVHMDGSYKIWRNDE